MDNASTLHMPSVRCSRIVNVFLNYIWLLLWVLAVMNTKMLKKSASIAWQKFIIIITLPIAVLGGMRYVQRPVTLIQQGSSCTSFDQEPLYLDAQGLYFDSHLEKVVDIWQSIELELTGFLEEVKIVEYNFWDDYAIQSYWVDLEEAGAQKNSSVIQYAKQYIYDNSNLFQDVFIKI